MSNPELDEIRLLIKNNYTDLVQEDPSVSEINSFKEIFDFLNDGYVLIEKPEKVRDLSYDFVLKNKDRLSRERRLYGPSGNSSFPGFPNNSLRINRFTPDTNHFEQTSNKKPYPIHSSKLPNFRRFEDEEDEDEDDDEDNDDQEDLFPSVRRGKSTPMLVEPYKKQSLDRSSAASEYDQDFSDFLLEELKRKDELIAKLMKEKEE
jgi:hypothetical protein